MPPDMEAMAATVVQAFQTAIKPVLAKVETLTDKVIGLEDAWADLEAVRARLTVLETKELPIIAAEKGEKGDPGKDGASVTADDVVPLVAAAVAKAVSALPTPKEGPPGKDGAKGEKGDRGESVVGPQGLQGIPGRDGIQGPQGEPGPGAMNGLNGRDGKLENLKMQFDGQRTVTFAFKNGEPIEGGVITFPVMLYQGVYQRGTVYAAGDTVTDGGQLWYCKGDGTITPPGDASKLWQLCVRKGRDGKDSVVPPTTTAPVVRLK